VHEVRITEWLAREGIEKGMRSVCAPDTTVPQELGKEERIGAQVALLIFANTRREQPGGALSGAKQCETSLPGQS
jgi:hypothetical protein